MESLSVVIPVYNVQKSIKRCLNSVEWANEIIVVDMGSDDDTVKICKKYGAKIFKRIPKDGNFDQNRKFGMERAKSDWVLKLDSDEELSSQLQEEIKENLLSGFPKNINGYRIYNHIFMFGKEIKRGPVKKNSNELRLFRNRKWHYDPYRFHQEISVEGKIEYMKSFYFHYNYDSVSQFIEKTNRYTDLDSKELYKKRMTYGLDAVILAPIKTFAKLFVLQQGFLEGATGIEVCFLYSLYNLIEKMKVYELQNHNNLLS